jgi:hypothetical protein
MDRSDPLLPHRAAENFEGAALLSQSAVLKRLAAAWPRTRRSGEASTSAQPDAALEDFWQGIMVDFDHWEVLAQVSPVEVMEGYQVLRGNGIILPDGTLNHVAESLLKKEAAGRLMADFGIKPGEAKLGTAR